jgi:Holliday junction resolvasome RuvABC endonuclease subunit
MGRVRKEYGMNYVMGLDVSLTHTGVVIMSNVTAWVVHAHTVIETEPEAKKRGIYQVDDNVRRATLIAKGLDKVVDEWEPSLIVAEMPFGSRSSKSATALGICAGVISTYTHLTGIPLTCVTPEDVKVAGAGKKNASKAEMMRNAATLFSYVADEYPPTKKSKSEYAGRFEHVADAIFAVWAVKDSPMVKVFAGG